MMNKNSLLMLILVAILGVSCSSSQKKAPISIASVSSGLIKNSALPFTLYLTSNNESRTQIIAKSSPEVFIIHTGHILKANQTKEQNEAALSDLTGKGIDIINLSIEDFIIADQQGILFENYPQRFLNSSVVDLNEDNIITKANVTSYIIHNGVVLIGISDQNVDKTLSLNKFLVSDYVLAILRARKLALKDPTTTLDRPLNSFVIIHTIGSDINDVMDRLPPNFINSLAN